MGRSAPNSWRICAMACGSATNAVAASTGFAGPVRRTTYTSVTTTKRTNGSNSKRRTMYVVTSYRPALRSDSPRLLTRSRIEKGDQSIADQAQANRRESDRRAWIKWQLWSTEDVALRFCYHRSPIRLWRLNAKSEEVQGRGLK